jgi:hypothetical protein
MTDPNPLGALAPTPRDRAAAWRLVLAMLNRDADSVLRIAHEAQTAADVDRFVLALGDNFQWFLQRACKDPIKYAQDAVAFELDTQAGLDKQ